MIFLNRRETVCLTGAFTEKSCCVYMQNPLSKSYLPTAAIYQISGTAPSRLLNLRAHISPVPNPSTFTGSLNLPTLLLPQHEQLSIPHSLLPSYGNNPHNANSTGREKVPVHRVQLLLQRDQCYLNLFSIPRQLLSSNLYHLPSPERPR